MARISFKVDPALEAGGIETHPEYDLALEEWERIRDVIQGEKYVKERGERYLPSLFEQESEDYARYKGRAVFFNATRRTRDAAVGLIMRKTPEIELEEKVDGMQGDVDLEGGTLVDYVREVTEEMASLGRSGTFIDWSDAESRPYFAFYHAEDIISWEIRRVDGVMRLTRLVLRECSFEWKGSTNRDATGKEVDGHTPVTTIRTFTLDPETLTVEGRKQVYHQGAEIETEEQIEMKRRGKQLSEIPFVFHGLDGNRADVPIAPLSDLAAINISHYQTSADLENGRHICGLPTPFAAGFDDDSDFILGTSHAWVSSDPTAQAGFIEFTGQGLSALTDAMKEKQEQMAALGARMLEVQRADAESFETVQLRSNAEQATLISISSAVSATVSKCLQWAAWWYGTGKNQVNDFAEKNMIVLNTDFVAAKIDGPTLTALVASYQTGAISWPTFYYQLQQGEFYRDQWSIDDEEAALLQQPAPAPNPDDSNAGG